MKVVFNDTYKSFNKWFMHDFDGNFIVISGINGTGKSQFLRSLKDKATSVTLNGNIVDKNTIILKWFSDLYANTYNKNLDQDDPMHLIRIKQEIKNKSSLLFQMRNEPGLISKEDPFSLALKTVKYELPNFTTSQNLDSALDEIPNLITIRQPDDIFNQKNISDIFYEYCRNREKFAANSDQIGRDAKMIFEKDNPAPWKKLNKTFKKLGFLYKFSDSYECNHNTIKWWVYLINTRINEKINFSISDLSDWEKAIFALTLASLRSEIMWENIKILVLDEYDAALNPSLTDAYFTILKDYFINKGIYVIISTHSPVTLTFAEKYWANFYEFFPQWSTQRIIKNVLLNEFKEMQIAYQDFYSKIRTSTERIIELEEEKCYLENIISNNKKPILFVEGPSDKLILDVAWRKLYWDKEMWFLIPETSNGHNASQVKYKLENANVFQTQCVIWLFDFDWEWYNSWNGIKDFVSFAEDTKKCLIKKYPDKPFYGMLLPLIDNEALNHQLRNKSTGEHFKDKTVFQIEHMFHWIDDWFDAKYFKEEITAGGKIIVFVGDKKVFAKQVILLENKYFANFISLFEAINRLTYQPS